MSESMSEMRREFEEDIKHSSDIIYDDVVLTNRYQRECKKRVIDVYDILQMFGVENQAIGHAIKKLLVAGRRGYKDKTQDLEEAIASIKRGIELEKDR